MSARPQVNHTVLARRTFRRIAPPGLAWAPAVAVLAVAVLAVVPEPAAAGSPAQVARSARTPGACPPSWLGENRAASPTISADGRFVAFEQLRGDPDTDGPRDVMLRDLRRQTTRAITAFEGERSAYYPVISDAGNRIAYLDVSWESESESYQARLVVYDRKTGRSTDEGTAYSATAHDLSARGRYIAFTRMRTEGSGENETRIADVYRRDVDRNRTVLVSTTPGGRGGNESSSTPTISADGRFVLFSSRASDLTTDGSGAQGGLYLRDLRKGTTTVIPGRDGDVTSAAGYAPRLSPDGRYVLYLKNGVWVYDRKADTTTAASRTAVAWDTDISRHGRKVAFSAAGVLVRTVRSGAETVVSVGPDGALEPSSGSYLGGITPNGRYVTFYSTATNLDPQDVDSMLDVYVRDLRRGRTTLVSTTDAGGACE